MNYDDRDVEVVRGISQSMGLVMAHVNTAAGYELLKAGDVYVVWFCKTLQNWKALVSTTLKDNMYYEVTYDGNGRCAYLDAYKKIHNLVVPDNDQVPYAGTYIHPTDDTSVIPQVPDYDLSEPGQLPERKERAFKTWENDLGDRRP